MRDRYGEEADASSLKTSCWDYLREWAAYYAEPGTFRTIRKMDAYDVLARLHQTTHGAPLPFKKNVAEPMITEQECRDRQKALLAERIRLRNALRGEPQADRLMRAEMERPLLEADIHVAQEDWINGFLETEVWAGQDPGHHIEALRCRFSDDWPNRRISYRARDRKGLWTDWVADGQLAGSTGRKQPLFGLAFRLDSLGSDGPGAEYGVLYRVRSAEKDGQWSAWAEDGADCVAEDGLGIAGIQVELVKKALFRRTMMKMHEDGFLVVIPYCSEGAQGRELEYAVAGWRRHFKEKFTIVLVGDHHPVCETGDDIVHIPCPRIPPCDESNYRPHLDHVHKFREVRKHYPDADGFIYACDDMYAVNDFDISDIRMLKQLSNDMKGNPKSKNGWQRDMAKTRALCVQEGFPVRNFICHLPLWYDFDKLFALYDRFDLDNTSYVVENVYFNMYYPQKIPFELNLEHDNLKCGIYSKDFPVEVIRNAFKKKIWISNSPDGWSLELDRMLGEYYGIGFAGDAGITVPNQPQTPEDQASLQDLAKRIAELEAGIKSCNDGLNKALDLLAKVLMSLETHVVREEFRDVSEHTNSRFGELAILCDKYGSDKGSRNYSSGKAHPYSWRPHTYDRIYELLFAPIRHTVKYVFECGIGTNNPKLASSMGALGKPGASLRVWRDYFAGDSLVCVWGADIDKDILFEEEKIKTGYMDQLSPETIRSFFDAVGDVKFDVMIDDGLHTADAAISLFDNAIAHLAPDGLYLIEDVRFRDVEALHGYFSSLPAYDVNYISIPLIKDDNTLIVIRHKRAQRV